MATCSVNEGLWFKKHFFEPSIRVPLFISMPNQPAKRIANPVSLVDLLPTLMGLVEGHDWSSTVEKLDGANLIRWINGDAEPNRAIYAEYLAESTTSPILMVLQEPYKFIWSNEDPYLLYDLEKDPNELTSIAHTPEYESLVNSFVEEIQQTWDPSLLHEKIIQSQRRRHKIRNAQAIGNKPRWNHGEKTGEQVLWYRGEQGYNDWAFPNDVLN